MFSESKISDLIKAAEKEYYKENMDAAKLLLSELLVEVKANMNFLKEVIDFSSFGRAFTYMVDQKISNSKNEMILVSNISYLFLSKAIKKNPNDITLIKDRLILLWLAEDLFTHTVRYALGINVGDLAQYSPSAEYASQTAKDEIKKMQVSDLELNKILYTNVEFFKKRRMQLIDEIKKYSPGINYSIELIIKQGQANHQKVFTLIEKNLLDFNYE
jgi:hypothetical protein